MLKAILFLYFVVNYPCIKRKMVYSLKIRNHNFLQYLYLYKIFSFFDFVLNYYFSIFYNEDIVLSNVVKTAFS